MLDCAANPITGFSPILQTKKKWDHLNFLLVSHPHIDHISDIVNIDCLEPNALLAPDVPYRQLREGKDGWFKEIIEKYIDFISTYKNPCSLDYCKNLWGDAEIQIFGLRGYQEDLNNYSRVVFVKYKNFIFAYGGDLTSKGWEDLIEQEGVAFTRMLEQTNFFEVAHLVGWA